MESLKIVVGAGPGKVEAGVDDIEYLGRWTEVKGGFSLGMEIHHPALTSKYSWECVTTPISWRRQPRRVRILV